jgi:hypothetical protein
MDFRRHSEKNDASCSSKNDRSFFDILKSEANKSYKDIITENCQKSDSDTDNGFVSNGLRTVDEIKQMTDHYSASLKELVQKYDQEIETLREKQIPEIEDKLKKAKQELKLCTEKQRESYKKREDLVSKQLTYIKSSYDFYMHNCVKHVRDIREHLRTFLTLPESKDAETTFQWTDHRSNLPRHISYLSSQLDKLCYSSDKLEKSTKCEKNINKLITKFETKMTKFTNDVNNLIENLASSSHSYKDLMTSIHKYHENRQKHLEALKKVARIQENLDSCLNNYSKVTEEYYGKVKNVKILELELKSFLWLEDDLKRKRNNVESNYDKLLPQTHSSDKIHLKTERPSKSEASSFTSQEKDPFCDEDDYFPVLKSEAGKSSAQIILENCQKSNNAIDNEFVSNGLHTVDEIKIETNHNTESLKELMQKYDNEIDTLEKMQIPEAEGKLKEAKEDFKLYEKKQIRSRIQRENLVSKQSALIKNANDHYKSFCVEQEKDVKKYLSTILKLLQNKDAQTTFEQTDGTRTLPRQIRDLSSQLDNLHSLSDKLKNSIKCGKEDTYKLITKFETEMTKFINDISNLRRKVENLSSSSQTCKLLESTIQEYHEDRKEYLEALKVVYKKRSNLSSLLVDYRLITREYLKKADNVKYWRANLKKLLWQKENLERKKGNVKLNYYVFTDTMHLYPEKTLKPDNYSTSSEEESDNYSTSSEEEHSNWILKNIKQDDYIEGDLEEELQQYKMKNAPSTGNNCLLYAFMMAAGHDITNEEVRKQVDDSINKVRAELESKGIVQEGQMLDPTDKCGLIAIQHLLEKRGDLNQFTELVIYAINETYRTDNEISISHKTTIPLGKEGNQSLYLYYDGRGEVGHYYALFPKNPAQPETFPSQNENPSQPETLPKSETSSSSNATQDDILHDSAANWFLEEESRGWCSIQ